MKTDPKRATNPSGRDPLDELLDLAPPVPENPWFTAKTIAAIREQSQTKESWLAFWRKVVRQSFAWSILATCFVAALVVTVADSQDNAPGSPSRQFLAEKHNNPLGEEISDEEVVADLEILSAEIQSELWANAITSL